MASSFGEGLGGIIGGALGAEDLNRGSNAVNNIASGFGGAVAPFEQFGQSFLSPAAGAITGVQNAANGTQSYEDFMKSYKTSPGAEYAISTADAAQNNSAAARGQLLSGSNLRELSSINQGISGTYANNAYSQYLAGNQQHFGQLEQALGNMFSAIGVGTTGTGQQAGVETAQMGNQAQLAAAQAKNDQGKGSGFGSLFSGLGSLATMF